MRNNFRILSLGILWSCLLPRLGEAREPAAFKHHSYTVAQERMTHDGVLVSRPNPTDEQILNFLRRHRVHTVEAYARWLSENTVYQKDKTKDEWLHPLDMLANRAGDSVRISPCSTQPFSEFSVTIHVS
jgi:hypothetical protein